MGKVCYGLYLQNIKLHFKKIKMQKITIQQNPTDIVEAMLSEGASL